MNSNTWIMLGIAAFIVVDTAIMLFVISRIRARRNESGPQE